MILTASCASACAQGREGNPQPLPLPDHEAELWGLHSYSASLASAHPFEIGHGSYLSTAYPFISLEQNQFLITWPMLFSSTFLPSHLLKSKWLYGKSASFHIWKYLLIKRQFPETFLILTILQNSLSTSQSDFRVGNKMPAPPMLHFFTNLHQNDFNSGSTLFILTSTQSRSVFTLLCFDFPLVMVVPPCFSYLCCIWFQIPHQDFHFPHFLARFLSISVQT